MKFNYMAVDPSKSSTGIFIKNGKEIILYSVQQKAIGKEKYTYISQKGKDEGKKKTGTKIIYEAESITISRIFEAVKDAIEKYNIELIIVENNPFSGFSFSRAPSKLAEVMGVIRLASRNIHLIEISNMLWKGILKNMIFLNTKKTNKYIELAEKIINRKFSTCDEVDAYCIGLAAYRLYKNWAMTDAQQNFKNKLISIEKKIKIKNCRF